MSYLQFLLPLPGSGGNLTFMQRIGGPLGLYSLISRLNTGGVGASAIGMQAISMVQSGRIPLNPTQMQLGQMLSAAGMLPTGAGAPGGGESGGGGDASPAGGGVCTESDPETTPVSPEVQQRIERFEANVRVATAPLGAPIPESTWLELQGLSFKTPQGIRLARQLLWYVKAKAKGRTGRESTKFRYNNRIVDLLDPKVEPSSFGEINAKTPLYGEHIAAYEANSSMNVIGSPFSSEETWDAIKTMRQVLRGAELVCTKAENVPGDAWAIFKYFVEGMRGYSRVDIDGQSFDFRLAYHSARGGGATAYQPSSRAGANMTRYMFYTVEDRRITVEDRETPRVIQANTIGLALAEADAGTSESNETRSAPQAIESEIQRGVISGDDGEIRITPGPQMHISDELEAVFQKFFDLPPFRFDMPLRTDQDYTGLVRSYAEQYVRLNRGATQAASVRRVRPVDAGSEPRTIRISTGGAGPTQRLSVAMPSMLPVSADRTRPLAASDAVESGAESQEFDARLDALLAALSDPTVD